MSNIRRGSTFLFFNPPVVCLQILREIKVQTFKHSCGEDVVKGLQLFPGARLRAGDLYESSSGKWTPCPGFEGRLEHAQPIWVRPKARLSKEAKKLLKTWANYSNHQIRVMRQDRQSDFYFLCVPWFNWDGRLPLELATADLDVIQELLDYGYVTAEFVLVRNPDTEHSTAAPGSVNETYILNESGRDLAATLK